MGVTAHQEEEKNQETKTGKRKVEKKEDCAGPLRSFRGQHGEKMEGSARGNWDPREGQT